MTIRARHLRPFAKTRSRRALFQSQQRGSRFPRDKQQEAPLNSPGRFDSPKQHAWFMSGIKHNKTIAIKTLSHRLKSCTRLAVICLAGGLKLN
jgi:hypothetical protein